MITISKAGGPRVSKRDGAGCAYCQSELVLYGSDWLDSTTNALFAMEILACLALIACLVMVTRFRWTNRNGTKDLIRTLGFVFAVSSTFLYYILALVNTGLTEKNTVVKYLYLIVEVFLSFFNRIGDFSILAVVAHTINAKLSWEREATGGFSRILPFINVVTLILILGLSAAGLGLYTVSIGDIIRNGPDSVYFDNWSVRSADLDVAYLALYLAFVLFLIIPSIILFARDRSLASLLIFAVILPCFIIRTVLDLAFDAATTFSNTINIEVLMGLSNADAFIYVFATGAIFVVVAIVAKMRPYGLVEKTPSRVEEGHAPRRYYGETAAISGINSISD